MGRHYYLGDTDDRTRDEWVRPEVGKYLIKKSKKSLTQGH